MKISDIQTGGIYHDQKQGVRLVLAIGQDGAGIMRVTFQILAQKGMRNFSYEEWRRTPIFGITTSCQLDGFAKWAKVKLSEKEALDLVTNLTLDRLKLSSEESSYMQELASESSHAMLDAADIYSACAVVYGFPIQQHELMKSLEQKNLLRIHGTPGNSGGFIMFSFLGAALARSLKTESEAKRAPSLNSRRV